MVSGARELPERLTDYLSTLLRNIKRLDLNVEVYLTGSYARGDWLDDSDVDLIVISEIFEGKDIGKRYRMIKEVASSGFGLEVLAYTPKEFSRLRSRSMILQDMLEYALKLT